MAYGRKVKSTAASEMKTVKEGSVMRIIDEFLTIKQIPHWRVNSGALRDRRNRLVRFGAKGMSDYYAIGPAGVSIWIECKRPVGGKLSEAQKEFLDCINRNGGIGIVANSLESLERQLKEAEVL